MSPSFSFSDCWAPPARSPEEIVTGRARVQLLRRYGAPIPGYARTEWQKAEPSQVYGIHRVLGRLTQFSHLFELRYVPKTGARFCNRKTLRAPPTARGGAVKADRGVSEERLAQHKPPARCYVRFALMIVGRDTRGRLCLGSRGLGIGQLPTCPCRGHCAEANFPRKRNECGQGHSRSVALILD